VEAGHKRAAVPEGPPEDTSGHVEPMQGPLLLASFVKIVADKNKHSVKDFKYSQYSYQTIMIGIKQLHIPFFRYKDKKKLQISSGQNMKRTRFINSKKI
jgi:hypothetical protein